MAGKKYWKISLVDMVITCENIGFITRGLWPLVINPIFSLVITITTRDIFQYFFPAIYYYLIINEKVRNSHENIRISHDIIELKVRKSDILLRISHFFISSRTWEEQLISLIDSNGNWITNINIINILF